MSKLNLLTIFIVFVLFSANIIAQESYIKNRWDIKLALSRQGSDNVFLGTGMHYTNKIPNWNIEANYGINEYITTGLYYGFSKKEVDLFMEEFGYWTSYDYNTHFAGLRCNFHVFPLFIKHNDFRFDLYLTSKLGGYYYFKPKFEYNAGLGLGFYSGKHFGLFTEYTYGNAWNNNYYFRYGIVIKFNQ